MENKEQKSHPDAARFADWILENRWRKDLFDGGWERTFSHQEPEKATSIQLWEMFFNEVIKPEEGKPSEKPDFEEWIKSKNGAECMQWPISDTKYLNNRLFWAFDAGRDRIWDQYLKQKKLSESLQSEVERLKGDGWISVKKRLPKFNINVLGMSNKGKVVITFIEGDGNFSMMDLDCHYKGKNEKFTHWMPLPSNKKDGDKSIYRKITAQEPVKSAEDVLLKVALRFAVNLSPAVQREVLRAMEEYANQFRANVTNNKH